MEILGLGYVGIESPHVEDWSEYGPQVLGFGLAPSLPGTVLLRMDERHHRIAIHAGERDQLAYLGWELRNRPAFLAAVQRLEASGFDVTVGDEALETERAVHGVAWFIGPDEVRHEVFYGQAFDPHSFIPGRAHAGFVAGEGGLGHVVLAVPELTPEIEHFMSDVMEFGWYGSGLSKGRLAFYRPKHNRRTHALGYAVMPGLRGLQHIGIEVKELDDVGIAYDLVQERGIRLMATLGRHTQDPVISFYSFTPSGFPLEYLWGGAEDTPAQPFVEGKPQRLSVWGHKFQDGPPPATLIPVETAETANV
jgi:2,3-dihydroxybiphenyl 1,2-dioxygenase